MYCYMLCTGNADTSGHVIVHQHYPVHIKRSTDTEHYCTKPHKIKRLPRATVRNLCTSTSFTLTWQDFLVRVDEVYPNALLCPYVCTPSLKEVGTYKTIHYKINH